MISLLISFCLATDVEVNANGASIEIPPSTESNVYYYLVILNPNDFKEIDGNYEREVQTLYSGLTSHTVILKPKNTLLNRLYYQIVPSNNADIIYESFVLNYYPGPLTVQKSVVKAINALIHFVAACDRTYSILMDGEPSDNMKFAIYNSRSGSYYEQILQRSNSIKVTKDEVLVIRSKSLLLLKNLEISYITLETTLDRQYTFNYGPFYTTKEYNIFNDAKDGFDSKSNAHPTAITELTPGLTDIMFYGDNKKFSIKANSIITICRTKSQTEVKGSAGGKEFTASTSMLIFNKNDTLILSSSIYPVVRVSVISFDNIPKFEKVLSFFGPKKLRVTNGAGTATQDEVIFLERKILFVVPNPYRLKPEVLSNSNTFLNVTCFNIKGDTGELTMFPGMCYLDFHKDATKDDFFQIYFDIKSSNPYQSNSYYLNGTEGVISIGEYSYQEEEDGFWPKYKNYIFIAIGVIVLILLIIACCCCCKKKKDEDVYSSEYSSDYYSSDV